MCIVDITTNWSLITCTRMRVHVLNGASKMNRQFHYKLYDRSNVVIEKYCNIINSS